MYHVLADPTRILPWYVGPTAAVILYLYRASTCGNKAAAALSFAGSSSQCSPQQTVLFCCSNEDFHGIFNPLSWHMSKPLRDDYSHKLQQMLPPMVNSTASIILHKEEWFLFRQLGYAHGYNPSGKKKHSLVLSKVRAQWDDKTMSMGSRNDENQWKRKFAKKQVSYETLPYLIQLGPFIKIRCVGRNHIQWAR